MKPQRSDFVRSFLRTFSVQGSWNYGSFLAAGLAYALLPLLRRVHAGDPVSLRGSLRRHLASFNAHPYLAPLAVGALARLEHDDRDPEVVRRFRAAVTGPLGAVGDRLVWGAWRPFCLLCGVLAYSLGTDPWTAALVFLVPYNAGHVALRAWAFHRGWSGGLDSTARLSSGPLGRLAGIAGSASAFLAGAGAAALAARLAAGGEPIPAVGADPALAAAAVALAAAVAGHRWPGAGGTAAVVLTSAAAAVGGLAL